MQKGKTLIFQQASTSWYLCMEQKQFAQALGNKCPHNVCIYAHTHKGEGKLHCCEQSVCSQNGMLNTFKGNYAVQWNVNFILNLFLIGKDPSSTV